MSGSLPLWTGLKKVGGMMTKMMTKMTKMKRMKWRGTGKDSMRRANLGEIKVQGVRDGIHAGRAGMEGVRSRGGDCWAGRMG